MFWINYIQIDYYIQLYSIHEEQSYWLIICSNDQCCWSIQMFNSNETQPMFVIIVCPNGRDERNATTRDFDMHISTVWISTSFVQSEVKYRRRTSIKHHLFSARCHCKMYVTNHESLWLMTSSTHTDPYGIVSRWSRSSQLWRERHHYSTNMKCLWWRFHAIFFISW